MPCGLVLSFNEKKGCGYIEQQDGSSLFFYDPHLVDADLKEGQQVYYETKRHESGLFSFAVNVKSSVETKKMIS